MTFLTALPMQLQFFHYASTFKKVQQMAKKRACYLGKGECTRSKSTYGIEYSGTYM